MLNVKGLSKFLPWVSTTLKNIFKVNWESNIAENQVHYINLKISENFAFGFQNGYLRYLPFNYAVVQLCKRYEKSYSIKMKVIR